MSSACSSSTSMGSAGSATVCLPARPRGLDPIVAQPLVPDRSQHAEQCVDVAANLLFAADNAASSRRQEPHRPLVEQLLDLADHQTHVSSSQPVELRQVVPAQECK